MALSIEKQSLEAHVDLCAERYDGLKKDIENMSDRIDKMESEMTVRMDKLDNGIEEIKQSLAAKENSALKTLIAVGFSAIVGLIGVCGGLLWYIIMHR
jgi:DNA anti-recombination protein RmuC